MLPPQCKGLRSSSRHPRSQTADFVTRREGLIQGQAAIPRYGGLSPLTLRTRGVMRVCQTATLRGGLTRGGLTW